MQNDVAADVHADYLQLFDAGVTPEQIVETLTARHAESLEDVDDAPYVWFAIGRAQWECGHLSPEVLRRIEEIRERGDALRAWEGAHPREVANVRAALDALVAKLSVPKGRPRKRRAPIQRKPVFAAGDCLAVKLSDGHFGAAIVLACPEVPEPGHETYGVNLIGVLDYRSTQKPDASVFERREWLRPRHGHWNDRLDVVNVTRARYRASRDRFEIVCRTAVRPEDPQRSDTYSHWEHIGEQNVYLARFREAR